MLRPTHDPKLWSAYMFVVDPQGKNKKVALAGQEGTEKQKELIAEVCEGVGWECPRLLEAMRKTEDFCYVSIARVWMERWIKGRVVLVRDAGYCASPISGMGTTLALTGAYNLASSILQHENDIDSAFSAYESRMRPIVTKAQALSINDTALVNPDT
ncbi:hypothetical protein LTR62_007880 [Meristemomyces frigidus]|uniref:FAD-binding domain-containing protein n=1 Tax=Meristemomyces frigidus TaxID=1508187 RepID=A0AAN7TAH2_9PEZI|nr:hypothetical protein LTR62_007880 [Meristemomyces frigidus]